uniref:Stabilin 2 n=1 Tax=Maylandia zebra TaxID=106582 RepID=A0A3P9CQP6_9CICH
AKVCRGYYGRDCLGCPGGFRSPCNNRGKCDDGFRGTSCELCSDGFYGPTCKGSNRRVSLYGFVFCEAGWTGDRLVDICQIWNGGCKVSCTYNGGCHEHAVCTMTAPRKCMCKNNYIGDGVTCEVRQLPISRCLQNNGQCHRDAKCTDLHFEDSMLGVFHYRSKKGQYKLNYTAAEQACAAEEAACPGTPAETCRLCVALQGGLNMCAAGWLDQARVAYPTTYSNPKCGFGQWHRGLRHPQKPERDLGHLLLRMQEVKCECKRGYTGDGFSCTGNLLQMPLIIACTCTILSLLLQQILNCSQASESGKQLVQRLSNLTVQSTLFVPDNRGLPSNQTLSLRDIEFHLSEAGSELDLTRRSNLVSFSQSFRYINDHFVSDSDIMAGNGIIHVIQGPLKAPAPHPQMHVAHKAGMGIGVVLLIALVGGAIFVGYRFYHNNTKPFQFHYFKEDDGEEEAPPTNSSRNICNPVYEAAPAAGESSASAVTVSHRRTFVQLRMKAVTNDQTAVCSRFTAHSVSFNLSGSHSDD